MAHGGMARIYIPGRPLKLAIGTGNPPGPVLILLLVLVVLLVVSASVTALLGGQLLIKPLQVARILKK